MPDDETTDPALLEIEKLIERRKAGRVPPRPPHVDDQALLAELDAGSPELDEVRERYDNHPTKGVTPNGVPRR